MMYKILKFLIFFPFLGSLLLSSSQGEKNQDTSYKSEQKRLKSELSFLINAQKKISLQIPKELEKDQFKITNTSARPLAEKENYSDQVSMGLSSIKKGQAKSNKINQLLKDVELADKNDHLELSDKYFKKRPRVRKMRSR